MPVQHQQSYGYSALCMPFCNCHGGKWLPCSLDPISGSRYTLPIGISGPSLSFFTHFLSYSIFDPLSTRNLKSTIASPVKYITVKAPSLKSLRSWISGAGIYPPNGVKIF